MFGIEGKTIWITEKSQEAIGWNDAFARYLEHIVQIDISHEAPAEQRGRYNNLVHLRGIQESLQGMPLIKWPGYHEAKLAITEVWWQSGRAMNIVHIPMKERKRLNDKLDPKIREYLVSVSENWTPNLIILFSVVFYILVELTLVVFDLEWIATT